MTSKAREIAGVYTVTRRSKTQTHSAKPSGDEWERILANARPRPKLEAEIARVREAVRDGKTEPMNPDKL